MFRQMKNKAGVSLVVVLLLMLVATIAATATYKWLSSSGRTSSSRMLQNIAYQSAVAGVENTRTWMTYHASDVGALIKQYISGNNQPVLLNPQLRELTRAGQDFDVWLVGVNTENSTYKLKIISSGKAANNTEYNLAAIFNVDGLYRVRIPQVQQQARLNFDYAYFASTYHGAGDVTMQSAVINGNWSGNPQSVTGNLIVTGNATLSGNNVNVGELACIGGNMTIGNQGIKAKDLYVHGASNNARMTVEGDAFLNGPVTQGSTGELHFKNNLTLHNTLSTNQSGGSYWVKVDKNLCMSETARIQSNGTNATLEVIGDVWMPGDLNLVYKDFEDNSGVYDKIILGKDASSNVYIKSARASNTYSQFNTQSYTETGKQHCPTRFSIFQEDGTTAKYNWIAQPDGHFKKAANANDKYVCGTVSSESDPRKPHNNHTYQYVDYTMGWVDWSGDSHSGIFPAVSAAADKYYMSDYSGAASGFVTFAQETLTDWKKYKGQDTYDLVVDAANKVYGVPVFISGNNNFGARFQDSPEIGVYKIKDVAYYDPTTNGNNYYNFVGNKPTGSPYCYYDGTTDGAYRPACKIPVWFKTNVASISNDMDEANKPTCAEAVLEHCNEIWQPTATGCDGSKFKVNDPLSTGYDNFKDYATAGCASTITRWSDMSRATACYNHNVADDNLKNDSLYNGYLVVKLTDGGGENCNNYSLDGKFIIIADEKISCQNGLPRTTDDSFVFMYLTKGAAKIGSRNNHYFIYTLDQIDDMPGGPSLTGTLYAPASSCKGVGTIQSASFTVDAPLLEDLANAAVICNNDGNDPTCTLGVDFGGGDDDDDDGAGAGAGGGVAVQEIQLGGVDAYYVSNAPTLAISIESQYKTDEALPNAGGASDIAQDFIVVPRIIYMPTDPYGTLDDYYNVIGLNGLSISKADGAVACNGPTAIRTVGPLYNRAGGDARLANNGRYQCTFTARGKAVPFYIIATGEAGNTPFISFTDQYVQMGGSTEYEVKINVPAHAGALPVKIIKPSNIEHWTITPNGGACVGNECTFNLPASPSYSTVKVFTVTTTNATSGTATFQLAAGEGYIIEPPSTITLSLTSAITVNRLEATSAQIDDFCSGNDDCPSSTTNWPDCPTTSAWVKATPNCYTMTTNQSWSCGIADDVILAETTPPAGCLVIIPPNEKIALASIENGETYELHASLKAKLLPFYFGFAGTNITGQTIKATITTSTNPGRVGTEASCTYGTTITATSQRCVLNVFSGERVEVRVNGATRPENFNYWSCSGNNCPVEANSGMVFPAFVVTSNNNNVVAHFDESDKHCFFDEFNTGIGCTDAYCIGPTGTKWRSADGEKLDYQDGYISVKSCYTENGVKNCRTDDAGGKVMSTTDVGLEGTLKAQFLVPQVPQSGKSDLSEKIKNTGFILRSNSTGSVYLLMNVYADKAGYLAVRICDESGNNCKTKNPMDGSSRLSVSSSTMVTMVVDITLSGITVSAMTNRLGTSSNYTASFTFSDGLGNYKEVGSSIGFRIADPMFKLYDIGWLSETYGSKCWDTPPTVNCSFRSAYAGGYVPQGEEVIPWVGLSSWFDTKDCAPHYYYKGDDEANSCGATGDYAECVSGYYKFSEPGVHGVPDANGVDVRTAKAGVGNCYYLDDKDALLAATAQGHCGAFWVGELTPCSQHAFFAGTGSDNDPATISAGNQESFNLDAGVNVREANLIVNLTNSNNATVEIVLKSQESSSAPVYYSRPFVTTASGEMTVDIQSMIDIENLDPQDIFGVDVRVLGTQGTVTVNSIYTSCPNVPTITCGQNMQYNTLTGKWKFEATATPFSKVKTMTVSEDNGWVTSQTYDCSNSECNYVENGKMATYSFELADNPYEAGHTGSSNAYKFTVNMTTNDSPNPLSLSCETNAWVVPEIQGTCGNVSMKKVKTGLGLPQFTYNVSNCPESGCTYKIVLNDADETLIKSSTGNVVNGATASDAANSASEPLAVGKYKFKLVSTDNSAPFDDCLSDEFEVVDISNDYDLTCGVSSHHWEIYGGDEFYTTDALYFMVKNNVRVEEQIADVDVYAGDTKVGTTTIANWSNWTQAKNIGKLTAGDYKYSLKIGNVEICSHSITVKNAGDDVGADCADVTTYAGQNTGNLVTMSNYENVTEKIPLVIEIDGEEMVRRGCNMYECPDNGGNNMSFNAPSTTKEYIMYVNGVEKCRGTITISDVLSCSANPTNVTLGGSFTFTTTYHGTCNNSTLTGDGVPLYSYCQSSYTITPTTTGTNKSYTYSVTGGSIGTGSCTVNVNVAEEAPVITNGCPTSTISIVKGSSMTLPLTVTGCTSPAGCNYAVTKGSTTLSGAVTDKSYHGGTTGSFTPTTEGEHTFTVTNSAANTAGTNVCTFNVSFKAPTLSCETTTKNAEPGARVTFDKVTPGDCGSDGCTYAITKDAVAVTGAAASYSNKTVSFNTERIGGNVGYKIVATNTAGKTADCDVTVKYQSPVVTCPEDMTVKVKSVVAVAPASVTNCTQGCKYKVTEGSTSGTPVIPQPSTYSYVYTSGTPDNLGSGFTGPSTPSGISGVDYYITMSNPAGDYSCKFNVVYNEDDAPLCNCSTYCGTGCENSITVNTNIDNGNFTGCIFATSVSRLQFDKYKINGSDELSGQLCWDASGCSSNMSAYSVNSDGGYYIKVTQSGSAYAITSGYNPCAADVLPVLTSCPVASTTIAPGGEVIVTPSTTTCNTKNGCAYTISGDASLSGVYRSGSIAFVDGAASNGDIRNYTLTLTVGGIASDPCALSAITYNSNAPVEITDVDTPHNVACGKNVKVSVTSAPYNATKLKCSGYFDKTVGTTYVDHNTQDVVVHVCNAHGHGNSPTACTGTFATSCGTNTLSCQVIRQ